MMIGQVPCANLMTDKQSKPYCESWHHCQSHPNHYHDNRHHFFIQDGLDDDDDDAQLIEKRFMDQKVQLRRQTALTGTCFNPQCLPHFLITHQEYDNNANDDDDHDGADNGDGNDDGDDDGGDDDGNDEVNGTRHN